MYGKYVTVTGNNIINGNIDLQWTGPYYIYQNIIYNSTSAAIEFGAGVGNTQVHDNDIKNNAIGIRLNNFPVVGDGYIGLGNVVYRNNLINNRQNVFVQNSYAYWSPTQGHANGTDIVSWDNGKDGNYWSDYKGQGTYVIDDSNVDHHPLNNQVDINNGVTYVLEIALATVAILVVVIISLLLFRRHRKTLLLTIIPLLITILSVAVIIGIKSKKFD